MEIEGDGAYRDEAPGCSPVARHTMESRRTSRRPLCKLMIEAKSAVIKQVLTDGLVDRKAIEVGVAVHDAWHFHALLPEISASPSVTSTSPSWTLASTLISMVS